jgi:ATP-dependent DNA helicase RecG
MTVEELSTLLNQLISNWENEVVEFKRGGAGFSSSDLGKYASALANEANLRATEQAWLVFGVDDKSRTVVGTEYKTQIDHLQADKLAVRTGTGGLTFHEIHVLNHPDGRVILFQIPAAPRGMPVAWNGHFYGRAGESLLALSQDKVDSIRNQTLATDWTAQLVDGATLADLDEDALRIARERFAAKHANRFAAGEVAGWSDAVFLDRARLTQNGRITRAALLLLGKPESAWRLSPHPAEMTWKLEGPDRAYEHFGPPFLITTSKLYSRIRNIQIRLLPDGELLAREVAKYDQKVVLEALHNCVAHQDYARGGRIVVIERADRLVFENVGCFLDGAPEDFVLGEKVPHRYRNPFLAQAMTELNMIDHMGYGISDIYKRQSQRYLPLPDYDITSHELVKMTIHGSVVDQTFARLLMQNADLSLTDILALDRIQKRLSISDEAVRDLRRKKLIEGRKPNIHLAATVAATTESKVNYIRTRAQSDNYYMKLVTDYLGEFGKANRSEIDSLLAGKLSDALTPDQKHSKISNLLTKMRRQNRIFNSGSKAKPVWKIAE